MLRWRPYNPAFLRSITRGSPENDKIAENGSFEPQDWENKSSGGYCQDALDEKEFIYMKLKQLALERERLRPPQMGMREKQSMQGRVTIMIPGENKSSGGYCQDALDEKEFIYMKLKQLALERERRWPPQTGHCRESTNAWMSNNNDESTNAGISNNNDVLPAEAFLEPQDLENKSSGPPGEEKNEEGAYDSADDPSFITQLLMKELKAFREEQTSKISGMEKKLANTEEEIKLLKSRCSMLESTNPSRTHDGENVIELDDIVNNESIILAGGYDGDSWLSAWTHTRLQMMFKVTGLPVLFDRLNCKFEWRTLFESYNLADNKWTAHPRLNKRNGNLSGATLKDKIFAIGGGNGIGKLSEVEMYDPQVVHMDSLHDPCGKRLILFLAYISMRFALAAAELNGAQVLVDMMEPLFSVSYC
ncbi:hypothetical protein HAX54_009928 [Datura stramonium]|uniref:Uncharacterized protein n=1 Tax=Datura stramonium TaxID=4076 RepID=A0ABS8TI30_DATST|nr:hypothetical protein [Datura stramonium]